MTRLLRLLSLALLAASLPALASAQDWAKATLDKSPRHGEYVSIKEPSGRVLQAWVVYPEVKDKAPVILMIHEIFGLSDWAREMADELAGAGYIVVAPDLLSGYGPPMTSGSTPAAPTPLSGTGCDPMPCRPGQTPVPMDHAHMQDTGVATMPMTPGGTSAFPDQSSIMKAVSSLDPAVVRGDLDAAADYGKKQPAASGKLFVAGFCWGGGNTFLFATHRKDLSAAFVFYGPPPPADAMKNITAPIYGFYAGNDARISATIPQTTLDMKAAGKKYDPVVYDGAGHGFMRAGEAPDATAPNAAARAAGFRRLIDLLGGVR